MLSVAISKTIHSNVYGITAAGNMESHRAYRLRRGDISDDQCTSTLGVKHLERCRRVRTGLDVQFIPAVFGLKDQLQ